MQQQSELAGKVGALDGAWLLFAKWLVEFLDK